MGEEIWTFSACDVVDSLKTKNLNQLDVLEAIRLRCEKVNPLINALPTFCFERAIDCIKNGFNSKSHFCGPLFGLPIPIKDSYPVSGVRTTYGSLAYKNFIPKFSDFVVLKIEESGGVIYGKSNTPEFEAGASTFNNVFGITRNPWNTKKSVAGSSGGAAASVATGMAFIAQGSDFACSIRYPASFCGVVGLRPTPGLIPQGPNKLPYQNLSVIGPLARNVQDIGLALDAMVGYNYRDPLSSPQSKYGYRTAGSVPKKPKTVGFSPNLGGLAKISREVKNLISTAVKKIESVGVEVRYECPDMSNSEAAFRPLRAVQFAGMWSHLLKEKRELLKPEVIWNIEQGLDVSSMDIADAEDKRKGIRGNLLDYLERNEFLVLPASPVIANSAKERYVTEIDEFKMKDYLEWLFLGFSLTLTGCPIIVIPCGSSKNNLPVGIQIVGKPHAERELLRLGSWLECLFEQGIKRPIDPDPFNDT